ncbi:serine/threonine-protein phosphatase 6 regulatory ankyrin repeat subunit B-like [Gigantopelta aegis]|uniref:serine/threonine-protein phosphatase 6 regulatory ankyrin repeat subunit B-like n=1 Tax=Gigantopelta aegis TaxID=1735272 RepID=UPI001B88CB8F|nr:serine/threonine-protein phosphatase 6 regulatory ankyrin repeat subunit B-like [Gigantopelta aegis]XP_041351821.1 serine/threonine-protein phosphatase 6 regulatory ankyrin repeat subunit B-like [Gigantopelta aegis]
MTKQHIIKNVFFNSRCLEYIWNEMTNIEELDFGDLYCQYHFFERQIVASTSAASVAVLKNLKCLSNCFVSNLVKMDRSTFTYEKAEMLDAACFMNNTEVVDKLLNSGMVPTTKSFAAVVASRVDDIILFSHLLKTKNALELSLHELGDLLFLALELGNGQISNLLIDEICKLEDCQLILERAAKQLLLQCHEGIRNLPSIKRLIELKLPSSLEIGAAYLFRKLSKYAITCKHEDRVFLAATHSDAGILKYSLYMAPNYLQFMMQNPKHPLRAAVCYGCVDTVIFLMDQGCRFTHYGIKGITEMHIAAQRQYPDIALYFLSIGTALNVTDAHKDTPLHYAVKVNCLRLVEALVEKGAELDAVNDDGYTPLHIAASNSSLDIVKYLVQKGSLVNLQSSEGRTPLMLAISPETNDVLLYLLSKKADPSIQDDNGDTPLDFAIYACSLTSIKALVEHGIKVDDKLDSLVRKALNYDSLDIVSYLIKNQMQKVSPMICSWALTSAVKNSDLELAIYLLRNGINPNETHDIDLGHVIREMSFELVKALVESGAELNTVHKYMSECPLHIAVKKQSFELVSYLVNKESKVNIPDKMGRTPFHLAVHLKESHIALYLLQNGADPNTKDEMGNSPLHSAVNRDCLDLVKALVEMKVNLNVKDQDGNYPLHIAAKDKSWLIVFNKSLGKMCLTQACLLNLEEYSVKDVQCSLGKHYTSEMVEYLLSQGADPNVYNDENDSPLHFAVNTDSLDTVKALVKHGANLNTVNEGGKTPLHNAAENKSLKMVRYLVEHGSELNVTDEISMTPFDLAVSQNTPDVALYLLKEGKNDINIKNYFYLHLAVGKDCLEFVRVLIEMGFNVNSTDGSGITPLHLAAKGKSLEIIKYLVEKGCQVNLSDKWGTTALQLATTDNTYDVIAYLLEQGADPNTNLQNSKGSLLHLAVSNNDLHLVQKLVESGAELNIPGPFGNTPLHVAVEQKTLQILLQDDMAMTVQLCQTAQLERSNMHVIVYLLQKGADPNKTNEHNYLPLHFAVYSRSLELVKLLVENVANLNMVDKDGITALHIAVERCSVEIVNELVEKGADVNLPCKRGMTALHLALEWKQFNLVSYLLQKGANPKITSKDNCSTLHRAVSAVSFESVKMLIEKGVELNTADEDGNTPLHIAVSLRSLQIVTVLVEHGSQVNVSNKRGMTPLHTAALDGMLDVALFLLNNNAGINVTDNDNNSPLHHAVYAGSFDLVNLLIGKEATLNAVNKSAETPLHIAVYKKSLRTVTLLVEKGSKVNSVDSLGMTPLHLAVKYNIPCIASYLLKKQADPKMADNTMVSPLHIAVCSNFEDIVKILVENGAQMNATDDCGNTPLHIATKRSSLYLVSYLVEKGSHVNVLGDGAMTPLYLAATRESSEIALYLLSKEADPSLTDGIKNSLLHMAVRLNSLFLVKALVNRGVKLNTEDESGNTPFHIAVNLNSLQIVHYLIEKGSDVNLPGSRKVPTVRDNILQLYTPDLIVMTSPLHLAVLAVSIDLVEMLVENGAQLDTVDASGDTPLCTAMKHVPGSSVMPLYLLSKHADPNLADKTKNSPLHLAVNAGSLNLVKELVANGAELDTVNESGETPLYIAVRNREIQVVKYLVEKGAGVNLHGKSNRNEISSLLHLAILSNSVDNVKILVENGAQLNTVDESGNTLLHIAANSICPDILSYLLDTGPVVNIQDGDGMVPSGLSKRDFNEELLLVNKCYDVNARNKAGETALYICVKDNKLEHLNCLLKRKPDLTLKDNKGDTVLHCAVAREYVRAVQSLVDAGVPDVQNSDGLTAGDLAYNMAHTVDECGYYYYNNCAKIASILRPETEK